MNKLIIIALILVGILSLIYLIRNNNNENFLIEKFYERNSLTSYFQPTVNSSKLVDNKYKNNSYNSNKTKLKDYDITENNIWNGYWIETVTNPLYAVFLVNNDKIIFSISQSQFNLDTGFTIPNDNECLTDAFVGIGDLNTSKSNFVLTKILCNNLGISNYTFVEKDTSGHVFKNNDELSAVIYFNNGSIQMNFSKENDFDYSKQSAYLFLSSFINPIPSFNNKYEIDTDVCKNSNFGSNTEDLKPCYITNSGMPVKGDIGAREYGTGCTSETLTEENDSEQYDGCSTDVTKTCFISSPTISSVAGGYNECNTEFELTRKFQSQVSQGLSELSSNGNNLLLCEYLDPFFNEFNSAIIMYVDELTDVESLNYEYFGQDKNQNNLTTTKDATQLFMTNGVLNKLKDTINNYNASNEDLEKTLRMTNCIESNNSNNTYQRILQLCNITTKNKINIESESEPGSSNMPNVWKININTNKANGPFNTQNSCVFTLSTSDLYVKESRWRKYAEFDPINNETNISLFQGGTNQQLFMENAHVISTYTNDTNETGDGILGNYILISCNLKTSNPKKYLIPQSINSGFSENSKRINLENNYKKNGKWVILGMSLNQNLDTINPDELNNKTLVKTLARIKTNIKNNL